MKRLPRRHSVRAYRQRNLLGRKNCQSDNLKFIVTVKATCITITPGKEACDILEPLINLHTYEDEYQDETKVLGFMYDEKYDTLYFHKGISLEYIKRLLVNVKIVEDPFIPYKEMKYEFEEFIPPRDEDQVHWINFLAAKKEYIDNSKDSQVFLVAKGGGGKSFCTGYAIGLFGAKSLIIMHRDSLRGQWSNSLYDLNGYPRNRVYEITSSEEFEDICYNRHKFDYDIYLMTHATFKAGVKRVQDTKLISDFIKNLGIGVKVIDEAHLEFKDTLLMDFLFNVRRNIYLTATDGRSQRSEDTIFKHVFSNATFYKKKEEHSNHPDKWVEYITINVNTHVSPKMYQYKVNGFKGMSPVSYGKWVIQHDKNQTHFKVCKELLREIYANEPTAKILVFMPLIELCNECALFLNDLNYDDAFKYDITIRTVNSHNSKATNETNKSADVIVTTIASLGTGSDIKGITDIICCSPFVSKITAQQVFWRIRYIDKKCHYYDIIDTSVPSDMYWWRSRSKMLKSMATKYIQLTWEEGEEDGSC